MRDSDGTIPDKSGKQSFLLTDIPGDTSSTPCEDVSELVSACSQKGAQGLFNDRLLANDSTIPELAFFADIGKGGFGLIRLAKDSFGRTVAVKEFRLNANLNSVGLRRFLVESEIAAALQEHRGVIPIHGRGIRDGIHWYAMHYVPEGSLESKIVLKSDAGRLSTQIRELIPRIIDVCRTLDYAHSRGVVHGDISARNVLPGAFGMTYVIDWGLARWGPELIPERHRTNTNASFLPLSADVMSAKLGSGGTTGYLSPEVLAGNSGTHLSDIYSVGMLLAYAATGERPDSPVIHHSISQLPRRLRSIVFRAAHVDPKSRYPSAEDLAKDLQGYLDGSSLIAAPDRVVDVAAKWVVRHRWAIGISLGVLILVGAVAFQQVVVTWREQRQANSQTFTVLEAVTDVVATNGALEGREHEASRNLLLDLFHDQYSKMIESGSMDLEMKSRAAKGYANLARIEASSRDLTRSLSDIQTSERLWKNAFERNSSVDHLRGLLAVLNQKCSVFLTQGDLKQTAVTWEEWKSLLEKQSHQLRGPEVLEQHALMAGIRRSFEYAMAERQSDLPARKSFMRRALEQSRRVVELRRELANLEPTFAREQEFARALGAFALTTQKSISPREAIKIYDECLERVAKIDTTQLDEKAKASLKAMKSTVLFNKIMAHNGVQDFQGARNAGLEGVKISNELVQQFPLHLPYKQELARGLGNLSDTLMSVYFANLESNSAATEVLDAQQRTIDVFLDLAQHFPERNYQCGAVTYLVRHVHILYRLRRTDDAVRESRRALAIHHTPETFERTNPGQLLCVATCYTLLLLDAATPIDNQRVYRQRIEEITSHCLNQLHIDQSIEIFVPVPLFEKIREIPGISSILDICGGENTGF